TDGRLLARASTLADADATRASLQPLGISTRSRSTFRDTTESRARPLGKSRFRRKSKRETVGANVGAERGPESPPSHRRPLVNIEAIRCAFSKVMPLVCGT